MTPKTRLLCKVNNCPEKLFKVVRVGEFVVEIQCRKGHLNLTVTSPKAKEASG